MDEINKSSSSFLASKLGASEETKFQESKAGKSSDGIPITSVDHPTKASWWGALSSLTNFFSYDESVKLKETHPLEVSLLSDFQENKTLQGASQKRINETIDLQALYQNKASEARDRKNKAEENHYRQADAAAGIAITRFQLAFEKETLSEEVSAAYMMSGDYLSQSAQSHAAGDLKKASSFSEAAAMGEESARYFEMANKEEISLEKREAYKRAAHYMLQGAYVRAEGNKEKAGQLSQAAIVAKDAGEQCDLLMEKAGDNVPSEVINAYRKAYQYRLRVADLLSSGGENKRSMTSFKEAAVTVEKAVESFHASMKEIGENVPHEVSDAYHQALQYRLQAAQAQTEEIEKRVDLCNSAALLCEKAASNLKSLMPSQNALPEVQGAFHQVFKYMMQEAEAQSKGDIRNAKNCRLANQAVQFAIQRFDSLMKNLDDAVFSEIKAAYRQILNYALNDAQEISRGNATSPFPLAIALVEEAATLAKFSLGEEKSSSPAANAAHRQAFFYRMKAAEAQIIGDKKLVERLKKSASLLDEAGATFECTINQNDVTKDTNLFLGTCLAKQAEALAQGKIAKLEVYKKIISIAKEALEACHAAAQEEEESSQKTIFENQAQILLSSAKDEIKKLSVEEEINESLV